MGLHYRRRSKAQGVLRCFTIGVGIYGQKNNLPVVSKPDLALSTDGVEVYNLMVSDVKVGTFTENKIKKTINIMIGLFN